MPLVGHCQLPLYGQIHRAEELTIAQTSLVQTVKRKMCHGIIEKILPEAGEGEVSSGGTRPKESRSLDQPPQWFTSYMNNVSSVSHSIRLFI